jgi:indolepyruvate ferredoxin oxidoreductase
MEPDVPLINISGTSRTPYFCSGCPHNTSTKVPEGSHALAGIGCHFMANWMARDTDGLIQMGGEGVNWITRSMFNGGQHVFQNLGDGTFYHSGSLAIRQAFAAGTNITFKILFNDAVAMTGGQPVDGPISVERIAHSVRAEGIERVALVSDEPEQFDTGDLPPGTTISHRREMDAIQRELRDIPGVTILIYAQTCATEKRRRRKRGTLEDPNKRVVINDLVCEGCGDCSTESNCLSVIPKETLFGRKRQIDQNNCNKDFSCVNGFCPSFVTVEGGQPKKSEATEIPFPDEALTGLAEPSIPSLESSYDLLVTGVGGTGVITVGALITMAAHLEGRGTSVLDFMGFAQKFGPVLSYIRFARNPSELNQVRIDNQQADALIGCDLVVSSSSRASRTYRRGKTRAVINTTEMSTADFVKFRDANLQANKRVNAIAEITGSDNMSAVAANDLAEALLGNTIYANVLMVGFAWQNGLIPVSASALLRAIELNGVEVEQNVRAFNWGRIVAANATFVSDFLKKPDLSVSGVESLDDLINRRIEFLTEYQDSDLADRYTALVERVREAEYAADSRSDLALTEAVARAYFKTLAYKDEYEVARLHVNSAFLEKLRSDYGPGARFRFHLAPPILNAGTDARGRPRKREFGAWVIPLFRLLAKLRGLRGTRFDLFGMTRERKMERALITEFESQVAQVIDNLSTDNIGQAVELISEYLEIRGYGPVKEQAAAEARARIKNRLAGLAQTTQRAA